MSTTESPAQSTQSQSVDAAVAQYAAQHGIAAPPSAAEAPAQTEAAPQAESPAAPATEAPAQPKASHLDRLAAKDKLYQDERNARRQLEQQLQQLQAQQDQLLRSFRADPLAFAREQGVRFGDLAIATLASDKPASDKTQETALPPALAKELEELRAWKQEAASFIDEQRAERTKTEQQRAYQSEVSVVADYLKARDYPLLNEAGDHSKVLDLVHQHVGQNGSFASDDEAAEVIEYYAKKVEAAHQAELDSLIGRPGFKSYLAKQLGQAPAAQRIATPARQEIQGVSATRNPARAPITQELASQVSVPAGQKPETLEQMRARTAAEMQAIHNRNARVG